MGFLDRPFAEDVKSQGTLGIIVLESKQLASKKIEGVLFDLDGTLNNSEWLALEAYTVGIASTLGVNLSEEQKLLLLGKPFTALFSVFPELTQKEYEAVVNATLVSYKKRNHEIKSYLGIKELLTQLKASGCQLGIVTAKLRENALLELDSNSILEYFELVLAKEDCQEFKPSPQPLLDLAERMALNPNNCIYLGDQPSDIVAANNAGMVSCAALWGEGDRRRLEPVNPSYLFETVNGFGQTVVSWRNRML